MPREEEYAKGMGPINNPTVLTVRGLKIRGDVLHHQVRMRAVLLQNGLGPYAAVKDVPIMLVEEGFVLGMVQK